MATTPFFGWIKPVVGASADVWGGLLNAIFDMMDTQLSSLPNTIKGNNTGSQAAQADLTPAQLQAMLPTVVGASQGVAGTKGSVPAAPAASQYYPLTGAGTYTRGVGRSFGCTITTNNVNGSQPTLSGALNVASISTLTVVGAQSSATLTFSNPIPDTAYQVHVQSNGAINLGASYGSKTTTTVIIYWDNSGGVATEISVSGF